MSQYFKVSGLSPPGALKWEAMKEQFCVDAGHSLCTLKNVILLEWENLVRNVISSSQHESTLILLDHMPKILDQLEKILKEEYVDEAELGKNHGYYRSTMTDFSLADIMTEYSLLREVLIEYLYPMGDMRCAKLIHKFVDILLKHSAIEFINSQIMHRSLTVEPLGNEAHEIKANPVIPTPNPSHSNQTV